MLCSACREDFGPGRGFRPGIIAPVESRSAAYYLGRTILYLAYALFILAWVVAIIGMQKFGIALLIGIYGSIIFIPAFIVGQVLVFVGRTKKKR